MPDTKHLGLQRKFWNTAEFPSFPIPDTRERKINLSLGILLILQQQTVLPVPEDMNYGIRPQAKRGSGLTAAPPKSCKDCPCRTVCGANESGQRILTTHIWQEYLDLVEHLRKTERGKELYAMRKETIERVFADAKEKHAMRYTNHRGLARVSAWVRLKYAAMNLKKIAIWKWNASNFASYIMIFAPFNDKTPVLVF